MKDNLSGGDSKQGFEQGFEHGVLKTGTQKDSVLLASDRAAWAWEFLRRNPGYRTASAAVGVVRRRRVFGISVIEAPHCQPEVSRFGICFAESADRGYLEGGVFWRSNIDLSTLCVSAETASNKSDDIAIDFRRLRANVTVLKVESGKEHVRLSSGTNSIALEVDEGTILIAPVYLKFQIGHFAAVPAQILTMDRLFTLWRLRKFRKKDFRPDQRRFRWLLALRALDMEQAGLSQREIADQLIGQAEGLKWRDEGSRLRSRVRRIIGLGRELCNGGYLQLLSGRDAFDIADRSLP